MFRCFKKGLVRQRAEGSKEQQAKAQGTQGEEECETRRGIDTMATEAEAPPQESPPRYEVRHDMHNHCMSRERRRCLAQM
jgi:hypothetical protein